MQRLLIVYATREGHTRRVTEHLLEAFQGHGIFVEMADASHLQPDLALRGAYEAVVIAGSVHMGKYEPELVRFVAKHRSDLEQLPSAFVSVSMSEAVLQSTSTTRAQRLEAEARIEAASARFRAETGWSPKRTLSVPGALMYRRYGRILRFVMRAIARSNGTPTDVSRDHVLTDWEALSRFAAEFAAELAKSAPVVPAAS
jgi:menaquinone-dependent protoporphyrinogen oxidase